MEQPLTTNPPYFARARARALRCTGRAPLALILVLVASLHACDPDADQPQSPAGAGATPGAATISDAAIGTGLDAGFAPGSAGFAPDSGNVTPTSSGGTAGGSGAAMLDSGATSGGADAGSATDANPAVTSHQICTDGYPVDPRDKQISNAPDEWRASNGAIDLVLPKAVVDWMTEGYWQKSHDAWHNIRRCRSGAGGIFGGGGAAGGGVNVCAHTELIPADQECKNASDGYQFLVMHRHMMQGLHQAFPTHTELFKGFSKFPRQAQDVPAQWQSRWGSGWSSQIAQVASVLEAVEQNLNQFATEGDLGRYIQCGSSGGASSIHGALHFKWVVAESPHSLGDQTVNIDNYMFWKLHGWIDDIWERYRVAKGLAKDEPKLKQALQAQCLEMHNLAHLFQGGSGTSSDAGMTPSVVESGYFHEQVRPIFDKYCMGCHRGSSPEAGLVLAGQVTSASIVSSLVGARSTYGGQFQRVVAGNPNQSWLYLKISGTAASAGCTGASCRTGVMPPTGQVTLTSAELEVIRKWIADGAPAPQQR